MCGRFFLNHELEKVITSFNVLNVDLKDDCVGKEIFPSNIAAVIKNDNKIYYLKWGFSVKGNKSLIINGRSESIEEKYLFKKALSNRCIIPASGFYDWKADKSNKIKYKVSMKEDEVFSMAGLYDVFIDEKGDPYEAFVILTTEANKEMSQIHHRMPVIFKLGEEKAWLSGKGDIGEILKPYKDNSLEIIEDTGYEQVSLF